jgi:hypothetical protein
MAPAIKLMSQKRSEERVPAWLRVETTPYAEKLKEVVVSAIKLATSDKSMCLYETPFAERRKWGNGTIDINYEYDLSRARIVVREAGTNSGEITAIVDNTNTYLISFNDTSVNHFGHSRMMDVVTDAAKAFEAESLSRKEPEEKQGAAVVL